MFVNNNLVTNNITIVIRLLKNGGTVMKERCSEKGNS